MKTPSRLIILLAGLVLCTVCASHNGFDRWVCLDSFKQANLHAGLLEVVANLVKESKTFHAATANNDDGTFAVQCFECFQSIFAMIKISW